MKREQESMVRSKAIRAACAIAIFAISVGLVSDALARPCTDIKIRPKCDDPPNCTTSDGQDGTCVIKQNSEGKKYCECVPDVG